MAGGSPLDDATVILWEAGPRSPERLAEAKTDAKGKFELKSSRSEGDNRVLYLTAKGPTPAIALMATLGTARPEHLTLNELTTIASVWTGAQFLKGTEMRDHAPGLKTGDPISPPAGLQIITDVAIDAAGNVWAPNLWQMPEQAEFKDVPDEAVSTRFEGNGAVVFFGLPKPVLPPLIGPVRVP